MCINPESNRQILRTPDAQNHRKMARIVLREDGYGGFETVEIAEAC